MHLIVEELATESQKEEIRIAQQKHRAGGVGAKLIRYLRAINVDVHWWCIFALNRFVVATLMGDNDPDLTSIAHYCYLSKRDIETAADKMTLDSIAVLYIYLSDKDLRSMGLPITKSVRKRAKEIKRLMRIARAAMPAYAGVPWFDPTLAKIQQEHRR